MTEKKEVGGPTVGSASVEAATAPSAAAFTPGPWIVTGNGTGVDTTVPQGDKRTHGYGVGPQFICDLNDGEYHEYWDHGEMLANARLIAAAPELLASLTEVLMYGLPQPGALDRARAVVAKATGQ